MAKHEDMDSLLPEQQTKTCNNQAIFINSDKMTVLGCEPNNKNFHQV